MCNQTQLSWIHSNVIFIEWEIIINRDDDVVNTKNGICKYKKNRWIQFDKKISIDKAFQLWFQSPSSLGSGLLNKPEIVFINSSYAIMCSIIMVIAVCEAKNKLSTRITWSQMIETLSIKRCSSINVNWLAFEWFRLLNASVRV